MNLLQVERTKYQRMWAHPVYRTASQGARAATEVLAMLDAKPGQSITDYGSGSGRAAVIFEDFGLDVRCVDIAENANESTLPVTIAPLWDLPDEVLPSDWCFCCDVLEHLPEEMVDAALAGIAARTRLGGFLQPAMKEDSCGVCIGETLHLTVKPALWWYKAAARHFPRIEVVKTKAARKWQLPLKVMMA